MISLSFAKPHRSIAGLAATVLPDFAIITGINGSGKSHLLEAIKAGAIKVDGIEPNDTNIRLFNWTNFVPDNSSSADPIALGKAREDLVSKTRSEFVAACRRLQAHLPTLKSTALLETTADKLVELTKEEFQALIDTNAPKNLDHWANFHNHVHAVSAALGENKFLVKTLVKKLMEKGGKPETISLQEFDALLPLSPSPKDIFKQNFSQIFATYHKLFEKNHYNHFCNQEYGLKNPYRSDDEFRGDFGEPPWDFVNRVLEEAHLDYRINRPAGPAERPFEARLENKTTRAAVPFQDLSSGEKIIMAFAICLYNASDRRGRISYPKLLLLDEVDAPLHPSMTKDLIRVVNNVLVMENGVKTILTTHSPATVAFSPDGALFRLDKVPRSLIQCTREQAVQALTSGYLSVTEGSRFVITEAKKDRITYTGIVGKLVERGKLPYFPNLIFIQASDNKDLTGGGREQVRNWSSKLPAAGLRQILGLIDRETTNTPTDQIKVIGRHSVENYLLDPILLYAVLMHSGEHNKVIDVGIRDGNYFELAKANQAILQQISDNICGLIERHQPAVKVAAGTIEVEYVCGKRVQVPTWLRDCQGHQLESAVRETFRTVIASGFIITRNECADLIDMIAERLPEFIPVELLTVFRELQST